VIAGLLMMRLPKFVPHAHSVPRWPMRWKAFRMFGALANANNLILFAIVGIFGWSYSVMMPAFARELLHGTSAATILLSANGIGALLGALTVAASAIAPIGVSWC